MNFLLMSGVTPFTVSLLVLAGLVIIELVLLLIGTHFFGLMDDLLPDMHLDVHADSHFTIGKALYFVGFGKVPFLMVLMSFLASFGLVGYILQSSMLKIVGSVLPLMLAVPASVVVAILITGRISAFLARIMPNEQTTAVSEQSFIGRMATVTYGTASVSYPATAEVTDEHGRTHHIQLKSVHENESFSEGSKALIVSLQDGFFFASTKY